jgi:hypothetical protein
VTRCLDENLISLKSHGQPWLFYLEDAILRPGNYTQGLQQAEKDEMTIQKQRSQAKHDFARLKREAAKRRDAASQAHRKRSKRGLASKDHDARGKMDLAHARWHISEDRKMKGKYILEMC